LDLAKLEETLLHKLDKCDIKTGNSNEELTEAQRSFIMYALYLNRSAIEQSVLLIIGQHCMKAKGTILTREERGVLVLAAHCGLSERQN